MGEDMPSADMVTMNRQQVSVLLRMEDGLSYPFRDIASDCRLSVSETRAIIHQFHRQGLTGFGPLYSEDGPGICGSGYWLRSRGGTYSPNLGASSRGMNTKN